MPAGRVLLRVFGSVRDHLPMVWLLLVAFFISLILLLVEIFLNMKDNTDSWILGGLFPYFALVTLIYSAIVSFSSSLKLTAFISGMYLTTLNLIPSLKYTFVYGYFDALNHFGSISQTIALGHVSEVGPYAIQYGATPGIHIFVSELSIVTGLDALSAFKFFLIFSPFIIPLVAYIVVERMEAPKGLSKAIIVSSVIMAPLTYLYTGTTAAYPLYALFISFCLLLFSFGSRLRSEFVVALVVGVAIIISHDATSFFLLVIVPLFLLFIWSGRRIGVFDRIPHQSSLFTLIFVILLLAHFTLSSSISNLSTLLSVFEELISKTLLRHQIVAATYHQGFYVLGFLGQVKILFISYGQIALVLLSLIVALFAMRKARACANVKLRQFYHMVPFPMSITLLLSLIYFFVGPTPGRGFVYLAVFLPFFAGLALFYLLFSRRFRFSRLVFTVTVFSLLCINAMFIFPFQPLLPHVSETPGSYYAYDLRQVNTEYDRSLVVFASIHDSKLNAWADDILKNEAIALTNSSFQLLITMNQGKATLLLLSESHSVASGKDAVSNRQYIENTSQVDDVLYSNGFSYLMFNMSNAGAR